VEPPAPYVTDTNAGASGLSSAIVLSNCAAASSDFGGKNSNEIEGLWARRSRINMMSVLACAPGGANL